MVSSAVSAVAAGAAATGDKTVPRKMPPKRTTSRKRIDVCIVKLSGLTKPARKA